jgi:bifunctional DNA-binding transcriptional regulator/antitoxin component of YhaV-PrlF toxin-antitoxin module
MSLTWDEAPKEFVAKISGGKITVPIELREIFALYDGDTIVFEIKSISHTQVKA